MNILGGVYSHFSAPILCINKTIFVIFSSKQDIIYDITTRHIVESVLGGYNGSIIAYGQTGMLLQYTPSSQLLIQ